MTYENAIENIIYNYRCIIILYHYNLYACMIINNNGIIIMLRWIIMAGRLNTTTVLALVMSDASGDSEDVCDGSDEEFGMTDKEEILGHEDDEEVEDEHTGRDEAINTENMEDDGETNCTVENDMNLDTMNENMDYVDENFAEDDDDINLHVLDELMELMENDDIEEQYYDGDNEESDYDTDTDENDDDLNETIVKGKTAEKNKSGLE